METACKEGGGESEGNLGIQESNIYKRGKRHITGISIGFGRGLVIIETGKCI